MGRVAFYTLGCKVNQCDSEAMAERFRQAGWEIVGFEEQAEVYIINTCTVTETADKKSKKMLRNALRRGLVAATGCYAQRLPEELIGEGAFLAVGNADRANIVRLVEDAMREQGAIHVPDIDKEDIFEELPIEGNEGRTRAYIKVQEGCDNHCTYCVIPGVRGPSRSRSTENILTEAARLAQNGYQEIVLTGICLSSYQDNEIGLDILIEELACVSGIERIRIGSMEPGVIAEAFAARLAGVNKLCRHFHISLQSGCDTVLRRMGRRYTTAEYSHEIALLREYMPDCSVTTDVIVGFPGETEEEFEATRAYLSNIRFSNAHIFPYSSRPGTPAALLPDLSPSIKKRRVSVLLALMQDSATQFRRSIIGTEHWVMIEKTVDGHSYGYIEQYVEVRTDVPAEGIVKVQITGAEEILDGIILQEE